MFISSIFIFDNVNSINKMWLMRFELYIFFIFLEITIFNNMLAEIETENSPALLVF